MKRFTAILLAVVLVFTCLATVACKDKTVVKVFLHYQDGKTQTQIEMYNDSFKLPMPTREGYTFGGWYLDEACTAGKEFAAGTPMEANFHLYAKWTTATKQKYTVTFVFNDNATNNKQIVVEEGKTVSFPQTPNREGYTFVGWFESQQGGVQWAQNNPVTKDTTLYARWQETTTTEAHTHDFGNSYFLFVQCSVKGCNIYGRAESTNYYENVFVYNFNETKRDEIDSCYDELENYIEQASQSNYSNFKAKYDDYEDYIDYVVEQYQYAYVFYCAYDDESYATAYNLVSEYYNIIFANYYGLYAEIYETEAYKDLFFAGWTEEDIKEALYLASAYSGGSENQNKADRIASDYEAVMGELDELYEQYYYGQIDEDEYNMQAAALQVKMFDLYTQFVEANNKIAQDAEYDNYMDYAYANVYGREYKPSDVTAMQNYVRTHIGPIIAKVADAYNKMIVSDEETGESYVNFATDASESFYYGLAYDSVFENAQQTYEEFYDAYGWYLEAVYEYSKEELVAYWKAVNDEILMANEYLGNYFKYMTSSTAGSKGINFFNHAAQLFERGNYFVGSYEAAYTYYIGAQDLSILYFGGEDYTTAFTFVHEFGHYYNGIYNGGMNLSMDHDETQSQGNEMMFLAWLYEQTKGNSSLTSGFNFLEIEQLFNILSTIIMSTAVDEFEQAAYSQSYKGEALPTITATIDGTEKEVVDYQTLYDTILKTYWSDVAEYLNTEYWSYVVVDSAGYYISYAMSALPSLEIYVTARQQGLDTARDSYFKLFTFSENETLVDANGDGECTYEEILNWCGLKGPFQPELYSTITSYFSSRNFED